MVAGQIDAAREDPANYARVLTEIAGQAAETTIQTIPGRWRGYYENVAAAIQAGDRSADLSPEAIRWLRMLVDKLDLVAVIEGGGPEEWSLRSNESAGGIPVTNATPITPSHRKRSTPLQGGRAMPSSIRSFPTASLPQIG